jgi:hypothetical protein
MDERVWLIKCSSTPNVLFPHVPSVDSAGGLSPFVYPLRCQLFPPFATASDDKASLSLPFDTLVSIAKPIGDISIPSWNWGFGPWEESKFNHQWGQQLNLSAAFSV